MDPLDLIDVKQIANLVNYNEDTVLRWFSRGIFFSHMTGADGRSKLSYYGSVEVRNRAKTQVKSGIHSGLSLNAVGSLFMRVSGPDDNFIVDRLKSGKSIDETIAEFVTAVRGLLS